MQHSFYIARFYNFLWHAMIKIQFISLIRYSIGRHFICLRYFRFGNIVYKKGILFALYYFCSPHNYFQYLELFLILLAIGSFEKEI